MPRTSTQTRLPPRQSARQAGIQNFARASKPGTTLPGAKEALLPSSPSKKRKLNETGTGEGAEEESRPEVTATPSKTLRFSELALSTPKSTRSASLRTTRVASPESSPSRTPSVEDSTGPSEESSAPTSPASVSPGEDGTSSSARPACFDDLLNLHSSFLTALSLHFAHNGASTPADLRELLPSIQKIWRKRKVVTKDLQRLVQVWEEDTSSSGPRFRIANYGLGKICLERVVRTEGDSTNGFDENDFQVLFERNLEGIWKRNVESMGGKEDQVDLVERLGLAPIHESLTSFTSFRKGQQRLQDLRGGVIRVKTAMLKTKTEVDSTPKCLEAAKDRRKGLLDRIKSKELRQSKLPPPPSKEMLLCRSAAERVEEVARVLILLRPSGALGTGPWAIAAAQKKPYRFETIVQHVQDSTRSPISAREVEICLDILAKKDVAGDWVHLVTVNDLRSVVLKSGRDISSSDIGAKVMVMEIGWENYTLH